MSRIGNWNIDIPDGVEINVSDENVVTVKGPKGELNEEFDPRIKVTVEDGTVTLERSNEKKELKSKHGLSRALINNMVIGVSEGYKIQQELFGVGYRATAKGQQLELVLGYAHPIIIQLPEEVSVTAETPKRANPIITLESPNKHLIGQIASKIRSLRPPEPYKGKGIRYLGEQIRRKAGKAAGKA